MTSYQPSKAFAARLARLPGNAWAPRSAGRRGFSIVNYHRGFEAVGPLRGSFLSLAYFDLMLDMFVFTAVREKVLLQKMLKAFCVKKKPADSQQMIPFAPSEGAR